MDEYSEIEKANMYFEIISECFMHTDKIQSKVSCISSQTVSSKNASVPQRTELEVRLVSLLERLREIDENIVV